MYIYTVTVAKCGYLQWFASIEVGVFWGKMCKSSLFFYFPRIDAVALGRTSCFPIQGFLFYLYIYILMIAKKKKKIVEQVFSYTYSKSNIEEQY